MEGMGIGILARYFCGINTIFLSRRFPIGCLLVWWYLWVPYVFFYGFPGVVRGIWGEFFLCFLSC